VPVRHQLKDVSGNNNKKAKNARSIFHIQYVQLHVATGTVFLKVILTRTSYSSI
jgi:hypothetical protein